MIIQISIHRTKTFCFSLRIFQQLSLWKKVNEICPNFNQSHKGPPKVISPAVWRCVTLMRKFCFAARAFKSSSWISCGLYFSRQTLSIAYIEMKYSTHLPYAFAGSLCHFFDWQSIFIVLRFWNRRRCMQNYELVKHDGGSASSRWCRWT